MDVWGGIKLIGEIIIGFGIGHLVITACWKWAYNSLYDEVKRLMK